jgi:tetratricopeptide (TPR) repeat protein
MLRKSIIATLASMAFLASALMASAQTGELRGHVVITQADGTTVPASDVAIDVFRTDVSGKYNTKTNKKGEFVFAGLPYTGTYIIAGSHPTANPSFLSDIKVGRGVEYEIKLSPGNGKRLTLEEINSVPRSGGGGAPSGAGKGESAADKAKREELEKKNKEILDKNKKIGESNTVVARTFKAGNEALLAKNYDEAIKQYEEGLAADSEQPAILTNKALAFKARGVDRYNSSISAKDDAAKAAALTGAKSDFTAAAEDTKKALDLIKAQTAPTAPNEQTQYNANKLAALNTRAEAMRLFVTKVDPSQVDAGQAAFDEYMAAETDPVKKLAAQRSLAQMLFDASAFDKALAEYKKILETNPDDTDALVKSGMLLFNIGAMNNNDKVKYQEAANYLQQFVEKAPDTDKLKADAKAILDELKNQQNVKAEKGVTPARRRRS